MTAEQAEKIIELALKDGAFLKKLLAGPQAAAGEIGVKLTEEEASTLSCMSADDFKTFADEYRSATDPAKRRAAC